MKVVVSSFLAAESIEQEKLEMGGEGGELERKNAKYILSSVLYNQLT